MKQLCAQGKRKQNSMGSCPEGPLPHNALIPRQVQMHSIITLPINQSHRVTSQRVRRLSACCTDFRQTRAIRCGGCAKRTQHGWVITSTLDFGQGAGGLLLLLQRALQRKVVCACCLEGLSVAGSGSKLSAQIQPPHGMQPPTFICTQAHAQKHTQTSPHLCRGLRLGIFAVTARHHRCQLVCVSVCVSEHGECTNKCEKLSVLCMCVCQKVSVSPNTRSQ